MFDPRTILSRITPVAALLTLAMAGACSDGSPGDPGGVQPQESTPAPAPAREPASVSASFRCEHDAPDRPRASPTLAVRDPLYRASAAEKAASKPDVGAARHMVGTVTADTLARHAELSEAEAVLRQGRAPEEAAALIARKKEEIFRR